MTGPDSSLPDRCGTWEFNKFLWRGLVTERALGVSWRPKAAVRGRQGLILGGDGFCAQMQTEAEAGYEESKREGVRSLPVLRWTSGGQLIEKGRRQLPFLPGAQNKGRRSFLNRLNWFLLRPPLSGFPGGRQWLGLWDRTLSLRQWGECQQARAHLKCVHSVSHPGARDGSAARRLLKALARHLDTSSTIPVLGV